MIVINNLFKMMQRKSHFLIDHFAAGSYNALISLLHSLEPIRSKPVTSQSSPSYLTLNHFSHYYVLHTYLTIIYVDFTILSSKAVNTLTFVVVVEIHTGGPIFTRVAVTFIHIHFTVFSIVAWQTLTGIPS